METVGEVKGRGDPSHEKLQNFFDWKAKKV